MSGLLYISYRFMMNSTLADKYLWNVYIVVRWPMHLLKVVILSFWFFVGFFYQFLRNFIFGPFLWARYRVDFELLMLSTLYKGFNLNYLFLGHCLLLEPHSRITFRRLFLNNHWRKTTYLRGWSCDFCIWVFLLNLLCGFRMLGWLLHFIILTIILNFLLRFSSDQFECLQIRILCVWFPCKKFLLTRTWFSFRTNATCLEGNLVTRIVFLNLNIELGFLSYFFLWRNLFYHLLTFILCFLTNQRRKLNKPSENEFVISFKTIWYQFFPNKQQNLCKGILNKKSSVLAFGILEYCFQTWCSRINILFIKLVNFYDFSSY